MSNHFGTLYIKGLKVECLKSRFLCPKSINEIDKRRIRGQKISFGTEVNGLQAFRFLISIFKFLFILAMVSTEV